MGRVGTPAPRSTGVGALSWIASLFAVKPERFSLGAGLLIVAIVAVPLLILYGAGHQELWLSFSWGVLYTGISDAVVKDVYATRVRWSAGFVLVGALLTALGYLLGGASWILVALAVFVTTLLSYLVGAYGQRGAVTGILLNTWFLITLSVTFSLHKSPAETWPLAGPQVLAWLAGGMLWMVVAWMGWMMRRRRHSESPPIAQATPARGKAHITRPLAAYSVLAAVAVSLATAVAWGFNLPNADWMPIATVVTLKPDLQSSAYAAGQRVAGTVLGAILAGVLLSVVQQQAVLIIAIVIIGALGVTLREVNYALYCTCIATAVLIAVGLPHPGNLTDNWERVLWTLAGVAIALVVMALAEVARPRTSQRAATA